MQDFYDDKPQKSSRRNQRKDVSAWEQTLRWLDVKAYSEKKLREKLNKLHYPVADIEDSIARCREYNLVNDAQLAEDFARCQSSRGRGSRRIAMELYRHGLTGEAAENALSLIAPDEEDSARNALRSKLNSWKNEPNWYKRREKAFRFLAARGYAPDTVFTVLDEVPELNGYHDQDFHC